MKHLYSLFRALDMTIYFNNNIIDINASDYVTYVTYVAYAVRNAAHSTSTAASIAYDTYTATRGVNAARDVDNVYAYAAFYIASRASDAIACAAYTCSCNTSSIVTFVRTAFHTVDAAIDAANNRYVYLQNILLSDIEIIQKGDYTFNNDLRWYGDIWNNFQQALEKEDCSYWGHLYKNIFENCFVLDKEALERRIYVPIRIQERGASVVISYLNR